MPEDAVYRVVEGHELSIAESSGYGRYFLLTVLLPRTQTESASAPWAFCYACTPETLGDDYELLSGSATGSCSLAGDRDRRAIAGLVVFNAFVLGVGAGILWGARGWRWWTELARLAGLAYLLGLASLMVVLTFAIVVGIPITVASIGASGLVLVVIGLVVGRASGRTTPLASSRRAGAFRASRCSRRSSSPGSSSTSKRSFARTGSRASRGSGTAGRSGCPRRSRSTSSTSWILSSSRSSRSGPPILRASRRSRRARSTPWDRPTRSRSTSSTGSSQSGSSLRSRVCLPAG